MCFVSFSFSSILFNFGVVAWDTNFIDRYLCAHHTETNWHRLRSRKWLTRVCNFRKIIFFLLFHLGYSAVFGLIHSSNALLFPFYARMKWKKNFFRLFVFVCVSSSMRISFIKLKMLNCEQWTPKPYDFVISWKFELIEFVKTAETLTKWYLPNRIMMRMRMRMRN